MTVQQFLTKLPPETQEVLRREHPRLFPEFQTGNRSDSDFALRLRARRKFAVDVFWFFWNSTLGGRAATRGYFKTSEKGCRSLCALHGDKEICPCIISEWDLLPNHYESKDTCNWLDKIQEKVEVYFLVEGEWNYNPNYEFFDWLRGQIGALQYKLLQEYGLKPPDRDHLPTCIQCLIQEENDLRYGKIWTHWFFYGNRGNYASLERLFPEEETQTIHRMAQEVSEVFESSREIKAWRQKLEAYKQKRLDSGIPLRQLIVE